MALSRTAQSLLRQRELFARNGNEYARLYSQYLFCSMYLHSSGKLMRSDNVYTRAIDALFPSK